MATINTTINKDNSSITVYLHYAIDIESFDNKIKAIDSSVYLDRLKKQYLELKQYQNKFVDSIKRDKAIELLDYYNAMRLFCLDTGLLSFNDIEGMEFEINNLSF